MFNAAGPLWTGKTVFKIQPWHLIEAKEAFYQFSEGFHAYAAEAAPAPVAEPATSKAKKKEDPVEERDLSLDDRVAFIHAKRLKLASFLFLNAVWEFDQACNATQGRVLKARFILKWAKNPDGSPRAKARVVTQRLNDPLANPDAFGQANAAVFRCQDCVDG